MYLPTHALMVYIPTMASYIPIHNPPNSYTFIHMYKVYTNINTPHKYMLAKDIEPWSTWLHTNVLAI